MWKKSKFLIINGYDVKSPNKEVYFGTTRSKRAAIFIDFNLTTGKGMFSAEEKDIVLDLSNLKTCTIPKRTPIKDASESRLIDYAENKMTRAGYKKGFNFSWSSYTLESEEFIINNKLACRLYSEPDGGFSAEILKPNTRFNDFKKIFSDNKSDIISECLSLMSKFGWSV